MRKLPQSVKKVTQYLPAIFATFVIGLLLNTYHQAALHYEALVPRSRIAVFISRNVQAQHQLIGEKIMNIEGVQGVTYIPQDKAMETAMKDAPALKEVLVTGDNPFNPYFLVQPKEKNFTMVQWLKSQITAVEGVEDVRFDANTFNIIDNLEVLVRFYGISIKVLFAAVLLLISFRYFLNWMYRLIDYRHYLGILAGGTVAGSIGAGSYYLLSQYAVQSQVLQLPVKYFVFMVCGGVLAAFAWEN